MEDPYRRRYDEDDTTGYASRSDYYDSRAGRDYDMVDERSFERKRDYPLADYEVSSTYRYMAPATTIDYNHGGGHSSAKEDIPDAASAQVFNYGHGSQGDDNKKPRDVEERVEEQKPAESLIAGISVDSIKTAIVSYFPFLQVLLL